MLCSLGLSQVQVDISNAEFGSPASVVRGPGLELKWCLVPGEHAQICVSGPLGNNTRL